MNYMIKYIPEAKNLENYNKYNNVWNNIYNIRKEKVGKKIAVHSANAIVYAEILKDFKNNKG